MDPMPQEAVTALAVGTVRVTRQESAHAGAGALLVGDESRLRPPELWLSAEVAGDGQIYAFLGVLSRASLHQGP